MQNIYLIIIVLVLAIIGVAHFHYRDKVDLAPNEVRVCAMNNDCHNVNKTLAEAVYQQAQVIAEADEAETFPVEAGDIDNTYMLAEDDLATICAAVVKKLGINPKRVAGNDYFNETKTVSELILFLHFQQQNQQ